MILPAPISALLAVIISIAIIAVTITFYQRETTGIETKYLGRSGAEIDAIYNDPLKKISESANYSDNNNPGTGGSKVFLGEDADLDGLINIQEQLLGTDIYDPDTDDDGVGDGIEIVLNTDPKDPNSGGLAYVPYYIPGLTGGGEDGEEGEEAPTTISLYKQVRNLTKSETTWRKSTNADFGDTVAFTIHFELINPSLTTDLSATISDQLGRGLSYIDASGFITILGQEPEPLPPLWRNGHPLIISPELNPQKPVTIEITFNASVVNDPVIKNMALTINQVIIKLQNKTYMDSAVVRFNK
ncbi:hypothetical protein KJ836_02970 [Patescibacteria group bacterium]|nr:hypothetical protein [Patescibacteria group bacterium]